MSEVTNSSSQPASFFTRVKAELSKLFVRVPGWEASAAATLTYVAPVVETVLTVVDPAAAPAVVSLIEKIQSAMAAAAVVIKTAGPRATLVTYLNAVNSDASQLLTAAAVKDPALVTRLTSLVATITAEVNAILAEVGTAEKTGQAS